MRNRDGEFLSGLGGVPKCSRGDNLMGSNVMWRPHGIVVATRLYGSLTLSLVN